MGEMREGWQGIVNARGEIRPPPSPAGSSVGGSPGYLSSISQFFLFGGDGGSCCFLLLVVVIMAVFVVIVFYFGVFFRAGREIPVVARRSPSQLGDASVVVAAPSQSDLRHLRAEAARDVGLIGGRSVTARLLVESAEVDLIFVLKAVMSWVEGAWDEVVGQTSMRAAWRQACVELTELGRRSDTTAGGGQSLHESSTSFGMGHAQPRLAESG